MEFNLIHQQQGVYVLFSCYNRKRTNKSSLVTNWEQTYCILWQGIATYGSSTYMLNKLLIFIN